MNQDGGEVPGLGRVGWEIKESEVTMRPGGGEATLTWVKLYIATPSREAVWNREQVCKKGRGWRDVVTGGKRRQPRIANKALPWRPHLR